MTTAPSQRHSRVPRGLWAACLLLVLAGLIGMHGLASHGPDDMPTVPGILTAKTAGAADGSRVGVVPRHAVPGMATATTAAGMLEDAAHVAARAAGTGHDHGRGHGMVGLCLAVLAGALIAGILSSRRPGPRLPVPVGRMSAALGGPGRDRDPPSLTWLSIRRC